MPSVEFDLRARGGATVRAAVRGVVDSARRDSANATKVAIANANNASRAEIAAANRTERAKRDARRESLKALAQIARDQKKVADDAARAEQRVTASSARETDKRLNKEAAASRARSQAIIRWAESVERAEKRATAATERESRIRLRADMRAREARGRSWGQHAQQGVTSALGYAGTMHGQIQDARRRAAGIETSLNSTFQQSGASNAEIAEMRRVFVQRMRDRHIDVGSATEALGAAQTRFNALGADTPAERMRALEQTMRDLDFANTIDPSDLGGLPAFSAMLRQQLGNGAGAGALRDEILRNTTGISFSGSVETNEALARGLPGMLRTLSSNLANTSDAQRGTTIRDSVSDFMAQIQTTAASGGAVTVSANRMSTLRTALNNNYNQDRVGRALAARSMNAEQRTAFQQAFTRDRRTGGYSMNETLRNSPSEAAAFFGRMFNNDATALSNFMGTHGGGGRRQLLQKNIVDLLGSYFATGTNAQGQSMRQYELERELRTQTLTPERIADLQALRDSETRAALNDEDSARDAALTMDSAAKRFSDAVARFSAMNPFLSSAIGAFGPGLAGSGANAAASSVGGAALTANALQSLASNAGRAGSALAGLGGVVSAAIIGIQAGHWLGQQIDERTRATKTADGTSITYGQNQSMPTLFEGSTWREFGGSIADRLGEVLRNNPPVVALTPQQSAQRSTMDRTLIAADRNRL